MITLRAVRPEDQEFLFVVYASTRADEMRLVDWDAAQKESFVRMQFDAQSQFYTQNYPGAHYQVVLLDNQPAGRLYVHRRNDEIRIMDITLLPEFRRRGIGSNLLNQIMEEGRKHNLPVTIHVERFNPALHLYARLGFCLAEDKGVYYFLKWSPAMTEHYENTGYTAER